MAASFPEKTEVERQQIVRRFYRNFTDVFLETIKLLHVRDGQIRERIEFVGVEQIDRCTAEGRSVGLYCSHFGNWEWITSLTLWASTDAKISYSQVYRPLRNKWFDRFYFDLRRRFHSESIPKNGRAKRRREVCHRIYFRPKAQPQRRTSSYNLLASGDAVYIRHGIAVAENESGGGLCRCGAHGTRTVSRRDSPDCRRRVAVCGKRSDRHLCAVSGSNDSPAAGRMVVVAQPLAADFA